MSVDEDTEVIGNLKVSLEAAKALNVIYQEFHQESTAREEGETDEEKGAEEEEKSEEEEQEKAKIKEQLQLIDCDDDNSDFFWDQRCVLDHS